MENARDIIETVLPYLLSCVSLYATYLAGNKNPKSWMFKIASQAIWMIWIVNSSQWGFVPMNLALSTIYIRNYVKWIRESRMNSAQKHLTT